MKTILIINIPEHKPKFLVLKGDYSHLNNFFIGESHKYDEEKSDEICNCVYDGDTGEEKDEVLSEFPLKVAKQPDSIVVVTGWIY